MSDTNNTQATQDNGALLAEIERLKAENAALKATPARAISCKVSEKGACSVYGLGRFPVTLYAGQWERLLSAENVAKVTAFLKANAEKLARKSE